MASAGPPRNSVGEIEEEPDVEAGQRAAGIEIEGLPDVEAGQLVEVEGNDIEAVKEPDVEKGQQTVGDRPIPRDETRILRTAEQDSDYMSPLYHSVFVGKSDAAEKITKAHANELLNCGPNGQNVLHVAALRSKDLTQKVLEKNRNLTNEADGSESTPLHFAASVGVKGVTRLLVEADTHGTTKKKKDSYGMCPIHIAASVGAMDAIRALVDSSAALTDANGRTFLHVAVENKKTNVVEFVCREPIAAFKKILNEKDENGNTALHLAVQNRDESSFSHLVGNRYLELNHVNKDGYTPLDLASKIKIENSFASLQNPTEWMIRVLAHSGAYFSARRRDLEFGKTQKKQQDILLAPSTETSAPSTVLVASALIATVTFAAAFNMPGSYKTQGHPKAGTPALGSHYGFKVFLVADILAFYCSVSATFSLAAYGTQGNVDPLVRRIYTQRAVWLFHVALKSVIVAFALGVTVVIWDISLVATTIVAVAASAVVLYGNEALANDLRLMWVMYRRFGLSCSWTLYPSTSSHLDWNTWQLRSFSATVVWNLIKLFGTYVFILVVAYIAQLKQRAGN